MRGSETQETGTKIYRPIYSTSTRGVKTGRNQDYSERLFRDFRGRQGWCLGYTTILNVPVGQREPMEESGTVMSTVAEK